MLRRAILPTRFITALDKQEVYKPYLLLSIAALSLASLQFFLGIKYSWDSNWYLIFSDTIGGNLDFDRRAVHAPLFYWSLGILRLIGLNSESAIFVYWFLIYYLFLLTYYSASRGVLIAIFMTFAVLTNPTTINLYRYAWTELGYSAILMFAIYSLYSLTVLGETKFKTLFLIAIALLPLQRYIGGYVSVYMGLIYLFSQGKDDLVRRVLKLAIATLPSLFVISWNLFLTGEISGPRHVSNNTPEVLRNLAFIVIRDNFFSEWILLLLGIISSLILIKRKRDFLALAIFLVPVVQVFSQIHASSIVDFDRIHPRFFIVLTPSIVMVLFLMTKTLAEENHVRMHLYPAIFIIILSLGNYIFGNFKMYPPLKKELLGQYAQIRNALSNIPNATTVGLFVRNTQHMPAELVLTSRIIPVEHCQKYKTVGSFRLNQISFVPDCRNQSGHIYVPVRMHDPSKPDYILVSKLRIPKNWQESFHGYNFLDLESFIFLSKTFNDTQVLN